MTIGLRLLTFPPMINSETSRLLLRHYGLAYREEPHAFGWGSTLALFRTGSPEVPVLYGTGLTQTGPRGIIDQWDADQPPGRALLPPDPMLRGRAEADWDRFNGTLATYTARLAYYHLLPHRGILIEPFTRGIPGWEASLTRAIYPLQRGILSLLLRLNAPNAADALTQIRLIFDETDARVRDGRPFLLGERITLGDIALAAAAAPVTVPDGNRSPIPALASMPVVYAAIVDEMRKRPTAAFVQSVYRAIGATT